MIKYLITSCLVIFSCFTLLQPIAQAAEVDVFKDVCRGNPNAAVCKDKNLGKDSSGKTRNPLFGPEGILTKVINILSIIVGIAAVIVIIAGGLKFVTSGSNPQEVTNAREMVLYAIVGLLLAASAQLIVRLFLMKIG